MDALIRKQALASDTWLLVDEIPGVDVRCHTLAAGESVKLLPLQDSVRILVGLRGTGSLITDSDNQTVADEVWVFVPIPDLSLNVRATAELTFLDVRRRSLPEDEQELAACRDGLPYFVTYSGCSRYRESFKSEKTINRTLMPEGCLPRLAMGSVETEGPDEVGAHAHPMLEQFFLGLSDNDCIVHADGREQALGGDELLHIPRGSSHGVRVPAGKKLHYVWFDFFETADGLEWIRTMHTVE